jgi:hypothetical protein
MGRRSGCGMSASAGAFDERAESESDAMNASIASMIGSIGSIGAAGDAACGAPRGVHADG